LTGLLTSIAQRESELLPHYIAEATTFVLSNDERHALDRRGAAS
jgi:chromosome condensin MukBEF ATPase and DNA-binding subunit MukB